MKITRILLGFALLLLGLKASYDLWYTDIVADASGISALLMVWLFSGVALAFAFLHLRTRDFFYLLVVGGALLTHIVMHFFMEYRKDALLAKEGQTTFAVVSFRSKVKRGKSRNEEVHYTYYVDDKPFSKSHSMTQFIRTNNIKMGDTVIVRYLPDRPHWHLIVEEKKKRNQ